MTLLTMTIPDEPDELPRWLEGRLMAPDFGQFIAELWAHFPTTATQPRHLLDRWVPLALVEGLGPIPQEVLCELLHYPGLLAAFQERVVIDGGAYWDDLPDASDDLSERLKRGKLTLERTSAADTPPAAGKATPEAEPKTVMPKVVNRTGGRGYRMWAIVSTGVAVCLTVVVALLVGGKPDELPVVKAQIAWGWAKPSGLAFDQSSPSAYLSQLAANAEEWSL